MRPTKAELRDRYRRRRQALPPTVVARCSACVVAQLRKLPEVAGASLLAFYVAVAGEIDLTELISDFERQGKGILLPRHNAAAKCYEMVRIHNLAADTTPGHYGILEPESRLTALPRAALRDRRLAWLVPGVLFDVSGQRLGQGGGFYDRLLSEVSGPKIGIGYEWQVLDRVPTAPHDVPMDLLVTDADIRRPADLGAATEDDASARGRKPVPSQVNRWTED